MSKNDHHLNIEEDFFFHDRKSSKKERKELSLKDRSKYKKTDQDKISKKEDKKPLEHLSEGRVLAILGEELSVESQGRFLSCTLRGALKKEKTKQKNLVAVGDLILFEETNENSGVVVKILPRHSILSRADNLRRNKEQIIAANIDLVFIVVSVIMPILKPSLIDRYIIAAKEGNLTPVIVINKIDLLSSRPESIDPATYDQQVELYHEFLEVYRELDIPLVEVSTVTNEGLDRLKEMMHGKTSVFSGQSGVGKTSLINLVLGTEYKTADIVLKTYKGSHTTTTAQLIPIDRESFCIDTPGIRSFGIWDLTDQKLDEYFFEFLPFKSCCKYQNCTHIHEPGCAIKEAVEEGKISEMRYSSYSDLKTIPDDIWRQKNL
jgi:ribosome biogenesis GTPase